MTPIKNFNQLISHLSSLDNRARVAVICAADQSSQNAILKALEMKFIHAIFVGSCAEVRKNEAFEAYREYITLIDADSNEDACAKAIALVRHGEADILMKGLVNTDTMLRAILDKEKGILPKGNVLTHVTAAQMPYYDKLLFFSDPAVIPCPSIEQRREQLKYIIHICQSFGIDCPKISLIHCTEKVNGKTFPITLDYEQLKAEARDGAFGTCCIDGPLDLKTSICPESMQIKGIDSPIGGQADALLFPGIQSANVFYKTITFLPQTETACCIQGTLSPVVVTSRSDSDATKFYSLALAAIQKK